jgi:LPS sulfotransferase NodH
MKNIAIYTMGRAGTTWLADYIIVNFEANGIPVNCVWEYWGEDRIYHDPNGHIELDSMSDWDWAYQTVDQSALFDSKLALLEKHSNTVHMYRQSEHEGYSDRPFDYILSTPAQIVCVNRQDKFEQMLSTFIARQSGQWHVWNQKDLSQYNKTLATAPITIDLNRATTWCNVHLLYNQRRKRLIESGLLIANLTYETLFDTAELVVKRMLKDRGVVAPVTIKPAELNISTLKLATLEQKEQYVTNYRELKYWFEKHNWQQKLS